MTGQRQQQRKGFVISAAGLATIAGLAALNYSYATTDIDVSPVSSSVAASAAAPTPPPVVELALPNFDEKDRNDILARPLFQPDRRPAAAEQAMAEPASPQQPVQAAPAPIPLPAGLRLVGVYRNGPAPRALIKSAQTVQAQWFDLNSVFEGWTVTEIGSASVTLQQGQQRQVVELLSGLATTAKSQELLDRK